MQEDFWGDNPCGIDGTYEEIAKHRYGMEPYLPLHLKLIRKKLRTNYKILEIGSGQGTDAIFLCSMLSKDNEYLGVDYSGESVEISKRNRDEYTKNNTLPCVPKFLSGDALNLKISDNEFDFVYSMGVIHHTPDMQGAVNELYRILKKGGLATIYLYRTGSIKVEIAKFLRNLQKIIDFILRREKSIFLLFKNSKSKIFGTMFLECFGVPILKSISGRQIEDLFSDFLSVEFTPCGYNFPWFSKKNTDGFNKYGYFYKIDLVK